MRDVALTLEGSGAERWSSFRRIPVILKPLRGFACA